MKCRWAQSTSSSTTTFESGAICSNGIVDEASSSSASAGQSIHAMTNQAMPSMLSQTQTQTQIQTNANNANIQMHNDKRLKLQQPLIDSEDTCSNDAFMFKLNQNEQQFNSKHNGKIFPAVK